MQLANKELGRERGDNLTNTVLKKEQKVRVISFIEVTNI